MLRLDPIARSHGTAATWRRSDMGTWRREQTNPSLYRRVALHCRVSPSLSPVAVNVRGIKIALESRKYAFEVPERCWNWHAQELWRARDI